MPPLLTCTIQYRPDLGVLVARWPHDAPFAQLQTDFEAILDAARAHQVAHWLLDVRRRENLAPELAEWTTHDFYPRSAEQLRPAVLRIAALVSPARLAVYETSDLQRDILAYGQDAGRTYRLRLFGDEGAAVDWLRS